MADGPSGPGRESGYSNVEAGMFAMLVALLAVIVVVALGLGATSLLTSGSQEVAATDRVPTRPDAAAWDDAPVRTVDLSEQQMAPPFGGGTVDSMRVRAVANDTRVGFRLTWADPTHDASTSSPRNYSDATAVMLHAGSQPPITMGATGDPVNIWYWRASWETDPTAYGSGGMYAYPHDEDVTKPGLAVGNPISTARADPGRHAQNLLAEGYGSLSVAPTQPVEANGVRTANGWSVTFVRERGAGGEHDVAFDADETIYLAFAVWNGSADEANGRKSITLQFSTLDVESGTIASATDAGPTTPGEQSSTGGPLSVFWATVAAFGASAVWLATYGRLKR